MQNNHLMSDMMDEGDPSMQRMQHLMNEMMGDDRIESLRPQSRQRMQNMMSDMINEENSPFQSMHHPQLSPRPPQQGARVVPVQVIRTSGPSLNVSNTNLSTGSNNSNGSDERVDRNERNERNERQERQGGSERPERNESRNEPREASPRQTPPSSYNTEPRRTIPLIQRKTSIDDFNEQIVNMLDDVERRVEQFRETAATLEQEKEEILGMLRNVNLNTEMMRLPEGEREDINAITHRLLSRTKTVDVSVNTPRNPEQAKALDSVNSLIDGVLNKLQEDLDNGKDNEPQQFYESSKNTCRRYLNACSPDQPEGPIDQRFQAQVIECTADDQKKIRRKLAQIISQIDHAEKHCFPQD